MLLSLSVYVPASGFDLYDYLYGVHWGFFCLNKPYLLFFEFEYIFTTPIHSLKQRKKNIYLQNF